MQARNTTVEKLDTSATPIVSNIQKEEHGYKQASIRQSGHRL